MPTTTTVSSNYAGKVIPEIVGKAFKGLDVVEKNLVTIFPNVNDKLSLRKIITTDGLVAYACGHTPTGAITLSEKQLDVKKLKRDFSVCKEDFRATWNEDDFGASAHNDNFSQAIQAAIVTEVLGATMEDLGSKIWNADSAVDTQYPDGFIKKFTADAAVIKANNGIVPSGAAVTEATVEAELKKALSAIPVALRARNLTIAVSPDVYQAYLFFLTSKGISAGFGGGAFQPTFSGFNLTQDSGLGANTILVYEQRNLVLATASRDDWNRVEVSDEDEIGLLTGNVRGKIVLAYDVNYYNGEEIVYYLTTTTPV